MEFFVITIFGRQNGSPHPQRCLHLDPWLLQMLCYMAKETMQM